MTAPILTTERLTLACHAPGDLDELAAMWADPAIYTMISGKPRTREETWIRLLRAIGQWAAFGYGSWVLRDSASGRLVGEAGLMEARRAIDPPIDADPEVGWALAADAHGQGLAGEALGACFGWADANGIDRTCCIINPANAPSIRLAGRLGYRLRGESVYHDSPTLIFERMAGAAPLG